MTHNDLGTRVVFSSQVINTLLTALIVGGVSWVLVELNAGRERWARVEERINAQSVNIMEMRVDLNRNLAEGARRHDLLDRRVGEINNRVSVIETRLRAFEEAKGATQNK